MELKSFQELRNRISILKSDLKEAETQLLAMEYACQHDWIHPVADHIYHPAYIIPGDPPGTCGVDWRGPCPVEAKTEKRWKRTCKKCGLIQYTSKTKEEVIEQPNFH